VLIEDGRIRAIPPSGEAGNAGDAQTRVPGDHPLRPIRQIVDKVLAAR
jgi:hypothetical protein